MPASGKKKHRTASAGQRGSAVGSATCAISWRCFARCAACYEQMAVYSLIWETHIAQRTVIATLLLVKEVDVHSKVSASGTQRTVIIQGLPQNNLLASHGASRWRCKRMGGGSGAISCGKKVIPCQNQS